MKPDGVTMETTETTEAAAVAEPSNPPDNSSEQTSPPPEQPTAAGPPNTASTVNGRTTAAKSKSAANVTKKQPMSKTESMSGSRPGMTSRRPVNDVRPTNSVAPRTAPVKKPPALSAKPPGAATVPKKTQGGASGSTLTAKSQVKMPDKKPAGPASASAAMTNGTKPANGIPKKTLAAPKPRTTAPLSRPTGSTASKSGTSSTTKPTATAAPLKTSRPATAPSSHPAAKASTSAAMIKPACAAKTATSRAATAPSSGRTTAAQNKATAPVKKDMSQPPTAALAKKTAMMSAAMKKPDVSKSAVNVKLSTASTKAEVKPQQKPQQSVKPNLTTKPAAARFPAVKRVGQTPPSSPASKFPSAPNTPGSKQGHKPTQMVSSFTAGKRTEKMGTAKAAATASNKASSPPSREVSAAVATVAPLTAAAVEQETQVEAVEFLSQGPLAEATENKKKSEDIQSTSLEMEQTESNTVSAHPIPLRPISPQIECQQPVPSLPTDESASAESPVSPVAPPLHTEVLINETQMSHPPKLTAVAENDSPRVIQNLNEDEEEEEKEGSQLVSVSEMSGTTQPTEESRPGSAGPAAWRMGGALLSEMDSEEVSVSQQGASELSAPGVLEGTESMDDLGEGSLKGAMDMEGASAGSPDFEKVPEIPVNDYDEDDEDDNDRVCDMDVGSERTDEPQRLRHDNDVDDYEEDEDVEMASEGVTESGLESYGNADEDDFAEDERLDNLNRVAQPPPPPLLPSAPAAQWDQPNPFTDPWAEPVLQQHPPEPEYQSGQGAEASADSPLTDPCQGDSETPTQEPAQTWLELGFTTFTNVNQDVPRTSSNKGDEQSPEPQMYLAQPSAAPEPTLSTSCAPGTFPLSITSSGTSTPDDINHGHSEENVLTPQPMLAHGAGTEDPPLGKILDSGLAPASNSSSSSVTEDEASDMEGEAQLEDSLETPVICNVTFESQTHSQRCLSTVEESEEPEDICPAEDSTPPSATSQVSYGFDTTTSASNSNAQSTGESCVKSPGIFSLEELSEEAKEPPAQLSLPEKPYIECGAAEVDCEQVIGEKMANTDKMYSPSQELQQFEQMPPNDETQAPYFSAICEKTENSFSGFSALLHPQRRDHSSYPRTYCDIVKPVNAALTSPKLSCADLPPRSPKQQHLSPQLRRLEQHQRHLLELQQRREQQSRPLEEAEQERKRREEEEERKKKDEAEEEIKRNKEEQERRLKEQEEEAKRQELEQRKVLELQLHQQQEELKQRQQIMQWQQELQDSNKGQPLLLSPSSGLCTIYESLENSDDEEDGAAKCEDETVKELNFVTEMSSEMGREVDSGCGRVTPEPQSMHNSQDVQQRLTPSVQNGESSSTPPESPETPSPVDLEWGKKVDIVHQLINQTLLLNGDGCSSLLLLPGGAGGTLSPLESSLWPSLLPPLTPPSATVTSVSSFSPETSGSSPQGEWTVVELETHH